MPKRRGRRLSFVGGYSSIDQVTLTALHTDLMATYGLTTVGLPVFRTHATGIAAAAFYNRGSITVLTDGAIANVQVWLRVVPPSIAALRQKIVGHLGLQNAPDDGALLTLDDDAEVYEA